MRVLLVVFVVFANLPGIVRAADISGIVRIERKLTKRSVTAAIPVYQRGPAVELGKDVEEDPLSYERSRVAIWIEGPSDGLSEEASMRQAERRFAPDMLVVPVGSIVSFPNLDPIFHNVFSLSQAKSFDLGNYVKGDSRSVTFAKPGIVYVNCRLHPNMAGAIVVTPNHWNAKADRAGLFRLHDVPAGQYTVVAWHKAAGYFRKSVNVAPGVETKIDFFIPFTALETEQARARK